MGAYPVNPVLNGLVTAYQLAHAIKAQSMMQDELNLQKQRETRQAAVQDIDTKMKLSAAGAKPVDAQGNYQAPQTANIAGVSIPYTAPTPAPPGQTGSYGGQNYLIPTGQQLEDEQFANQTRRAQAAADIQSKAAIDTQRGIMNIPIDLGDGSTVSKGALPVFEQAAKNQFTASQTDKQIKAKADEGEKNRKNQKEIADQNATTRLKQSEIRANATLGAAGIRAGGNGPGGSKPMTENQQHERQEKADARDTNLSKLENPLHDLRRSLGEALSAKDGEKYTDPKTGDVLKMNALRRKHLEGRFDDATNQVNDIRKKRGLAPVAGRNGGAQPATQNAGPKTAEDYLSQFTTGK